MAVNKRLLQGAAAAGGLVPSEHFGVVLYEGDGSTSHSINGGKFGAAAYFNATNAKVSISEKLGIGDINKSWTISYWAKTNSSGFAPVIYARQTYNFNTQVKSDTVYYNFYNSAAQGISISHDVTNWTHVVLAHNGSTNTVTPYINGVAQTSKSTSGTQTQSQSDIIIGNNDGAGSADPKLLDQIRFFQKELSSSEVSTLYAETTPESLDPLSEDTTDTLQVLGDSSCIATYRFENDEVDLSGNYDITGTEIQYAAGRYGQAVSMNGGQSAGTSSLLEITNSITTPSELSLSIWFKKNATLNAQNIFNFDRNVGGTGLQLYINASNVFVFRITSSNSNHFLYIGSVGVSNEWNHVVITWQNQASGQAKLYLNNNLETTQTSNQTGAISFPGNNQFVGSESGGASGFSGELDQLRIFNKVLSASEVTTLYNENSLVASYRFEGNANDDMRAYDGTASNVTYEYGLGFTPDFVWVKHRNDTTAHSHNWADSTRGGTKIIYSNTTDAQQTISTSIQTFDTGGFTVGSNAAVNNNGVDYVAWCLKANGGTTSSNTDGSITSTVQANQDAGFSIVKYTGNSSTNQTIGHSLGLVPKMIIVKKLGQPSDWVVYHTGLTSAAYRIKLNSSDAELTSNNPWNSTDPTSSLFTVKSDAGNVNTNGQEHIAYCFADVDGFSKFGSYEGTAASNNIVETGFEPAFLMLKNADGTGNWEIVDNKRSPNNPRNIVLEANTSGTSDDLTSYEPDIVGFLSNGFVINDDASALTGSTNFNKSGDTYIYMAFAADPDTEAPTVAKSFSTVAYTGTGAQRDIDTGFKPGMVWWKSIASGDHNIGDIIRGKNFIRPNSTIAQYAATDQILSYNDTSYTIGTGNDGNQSGYDFVAWAWKADDNEPTINTEGSIDSLVSANANAGFSIVKYTGTGSNATIGHGLSAAPEMMIIKSTSNGGSSYTWGVYHTGIGPTKYLELNYSYAAATASTPWNDTAPTSTIFNLGSWSAVNGSGVDYIAYCFHSVSGYSKFGSYSGNNSGQTITTGFQPDFLMLKKTNTTSEWWIMDSVRGTTNNLEANTNDAENTGISGAPTFVSTGFNFSGSTFNETGTDWIYMAFKIN